MGFATAMNTIATNGMANAVSLFSDFSAITSILVGLAAVGMLLAIIQRFVSK